MRDTGTVSIPIETCNEITEDIVVVGCDFAVYTD
jgi:hypothetical protein